MSKLRTVVGGLLLFCLSMTALGDSWINAGSRIFAESSGERGFKVIAAKGEAQARGVLFYVDGDGTEKVLWDKKLANIPVSVLVSSANNCVVMLDTWGSSGYDHALVVYGVKGEVVADFKLADLLSKEEIEQKVVQSKSSRDWLREADKHIDETTGQLVIKLQWGKLITIDLKSGKVAAVPAAARAEAKGVENEKKGAATAVNLGVGTVNMPAGYTQKRIGTTDSEMGEITRGDGKLVVHYDIGAMAGTHMHARLKAECVWYREQDVGGQKAFVGLVKKEGSRQLVVTIQGAAAQDAMGYPSNFWADIQGDEDVADVLVIALTYHGKQ